MKYLGIDYGTKNIGLALSDDSGAMAFPYSIIACDDKSIQSVLEIIKKEHIDGVVVGHSVSGSGKENELMGRVHAFIKGLSAKISLPIHLSNEFGTSVAVHTFQKFANAGPRRQATKHRSGGGVDKRDDSAAAVLLQRYIEAQKNNS